MNDLSILPKGLKVPPCPRRIGTRTIGNIIPISKSDFAYMEERSFHGRFAIRNNRTTNRLTISERLATILQRGDVTVLLSIPSVKRTTKSPDGATWRTVKLLSAHKTEDGKLCVIEIKPPCGM